MNSKTFPSFKKEVKKEVSEQYFSLLASTLSKRLVKRYGKNGTRILRTLTDKEINIVNPELFFSNMDEEVQGTLRAYKTSKSIEEFFVSSLVSIKKVIIEGASDVPLSEFFIVLSDLLVNNKKETSSIFALLNSFILNLSTINEENPVTFKILDNQILKKLKEDSELSLDKYFYCIRTLFEVYDTLSSYKAKLNLPKLEIVHSIYKNFKYSLISYLSNLFFDISIYEIKNLLEEGLKRDEEDLIEIIKILNGKSKVTGVDINSVLIEMKRIKEEYPYRLYSDSHSLTNLLKKQQILRSKNNEYKIKHSFIDLSVFSDFFPPSIEFQISCSKLLNEKRIIDRIRNACSIGILKNEVHSIKVTLLEINFINDSFPTSLNKLKKELKGLYNKEIVIELQYSEKVAEQRAGLKPSKYIRIIGDVHEEINRGRCYPFNFKDDFVINCGDISGDCETTRSWIISHMRRGVFVSGNHFGYEHPYPHLNDIQNKKLWKSPVHIKNTRNEQIKILSKFFAIDEETRFLEKKVWKVNGVYFVGCCLYTDYKLLGSDRMKECMKVASQSMNDFKIPYIYKKAIFLENSDKKPNYFALYEDIIRHITPIDYYNYFKKDFNFLQEVVPTLKGKPVVIVTHHAPLPYSINSAYKGDPLSASFASDLSTFIKENPHIRLWCHGHTHTPVDYLFEKTRVISCPFGYYNENNYDLPYNYGTRVSFKDIKSPKSWNKILNDEIKKGDILVYD